MCTALFGQREKYIYLSQPIRVGINMKAPINNSVQDSVNDPKDIEERTVMGLFNALASVDKCTNPECDVEDCTIENEGECPTYDNTRMMWYVGHNVEGYDHRLYLCDACCPEPTIGTAYSLIDVVWPGTVRCDKCGYHSNPTYEGEAVHAGDHEHLTQDNYEEEREFWDLTNEEKGIQE